VVKLAGAIVVCAAAAFAAAFFAAGAGGSGATRSKTHPKVVRFANSAARAVAVSFAGRPAALKLPLPAPRHVKHRSRPVAHPVLVVPTPATTPSAPTDSSPPAQVYQPPTAKPKSKGGTGTGTTVVGP
jgi:hypothetical protein